MYLLSTFEKAILSPQFKRNTQNGAKTAQQWTITWDPSSSWSNPLMGWVSSADPLSTLKVSDIFVLSVVSMIVMILITIMMMPSVVVQEPRGGSGLRHSQWHSVRDRGRRAPGRFRGDGH